MDRLAKAPPVLSERLASGDAIVVSGTLVFLSSATTADRSEEHVAARPC